MMSTIEELYHTALALYQASDQQHDSRHDFALIRGYIELAPEILPFAQLTAVCDRMSKRNAQMTDSMRQAYRAASAKSQGFGGYSF